MKSARLFALLLFSFLALGPAWTEAGHENRDVATIAADRLKLLLDSGEKFILIDLRPAKELAAEMIQAMPPQAKR